MLAAVLFALALANPQVAERISRARAALDALEYEQAATELMLVVGDSEATEEQRFEANVLAGSANRVLGRDMEARLNFRYVLLRDRAFQLPPDTPPKVSSFFELVRGEVEGERPSSEAGTAAASEPSALVVTEAPGPPMLPLALLGAGGALVVLGAGAALMAEVALAEPTARPLAEVDRFQLAGRVGLAAVAIGAVAASGGGALLALGEP
jgi:hypothetical protein